MKEQGLAYCAAMKVALDDLNRICRESESLKNRLHQLDAVLEALKPMMALGERTAIEAPHPAAKAIGTTAEPVHADQSTVQMVGTALPQVVPMNLIEPADPIQRRINSVLGLAVA